MNAAAPDADTNKPAPAWDMLQRTETGKENGAEAAAAHAMKTTFLPEPQEGCFSSLAVKMGHI